MVFLFFGKNDLAPAVIFLNFKDIPNTGDLEGKNVLKNITC